MGTMETTPFSPEKYEVEHMANQVEEDADVDRDTIIQRLRICRMSQRDSAAELTALQGDEYINDWLAELGYDYNQLSVEARKARQQAKRDWGQ